MIHEILLCLTGVTSPLLTYETADRFFHPSEKKLLNNILSFSALVQDTNTRLQSVREYAAYTSTSNHTPFQQALKLVTPVITSVFYQEAIVPYMNAVQDMERFVLSKDPRHVHDGNNLPLTAITNLMDKWRRIFNYILGVLKYVDRVFISSDATERNIFGMFEDSSGYHTIDKIRYQCLKNLNRLWVRHVVIWVLYGHGEEISTLIFNTNTPVFFPLELPISVSHSIYATGLLMRQLELNTSSEVARTHLMSQCEALNYPIHTYQISQVLASIRKDVLNKLDSKLFSRSSVKSFLKMFRGIILLGDPTFSQEFSKTISSHLNDRTTLFDEKNSLFNRPSYLTSFHHVLKSIKEDTSLPFSIYDLANNMLSLDEVEFDESINYLCLLTGFNMSLKWEIHASQNLIFGESEAKLKANKIFIFLTTLRSCTEIVISRKVKSLKTLEVKLLLDYLWNFCQRGVCETTFTSLEELLSNNNKSGDDVTIDPEIVREAYMTFIRDTYNKLFLDNTRFAKWFEFVIQNILTGNYAEISSSITELYEIVEDSGFHYDLLMQLELLKHHI